MKKIRMTDYDMPRILTVDFSQNDINKIRDVGYNVYSAATGLLSAHRGMFSIPYSINDVEIAFFHLRPDALNLNGREPS